MVQFIDHILPVCVEGTTDCRVVEVAKVCNRIDVADSLVMSKELPQNYQLEIHLFHQTLQLTISNPPITYGLSRIRKAPLAST